MAKQSFGRQSTKAVGHMVDRMAMQLVCKIGQDGGECLLQF